MHVELDALQPAHSRASRIRGALSQTGTPAAWITWPRLALTAIALLSAGLGLFRLSREGDANSYYAAAVRSMLDNWHAFFFASLDRAGFVTVDKPPLGLWVQTASAAVFGFHGWSILLPEVLATVGSVLLVYTLVHHAFGQIAGLLAALVLAVAPINVAVAHNNTSDSLLVFTLLLAACAVTKAAERGSWRWLMVGMALVGLGFNIKMLQAYLVLPALLLVYLLGAEVPIRRRLRHLALGIVVLLVVSFSWATAVALTPASARPYVGSSSNNSIFNLIFGYNGLNRLLPRGWSIFGITNGSTTLAGGGGGVGGASENGPQGIFRLLDTQLGGQIGWLLPLAIIGLVVAWGWPLRPRQLFKLHRPHRGLVLWGGWLVTQVAFFSVAGFYHRYYLSMLSPAIAALTGIGLVALWHCYRAGGWRSWLLPAALVVSATSEIRLLRDYPTWQHRLVPAIALLTILAAVGLLAARLRPLNRIHTAWFGRGLAIAGIVALLIAPGVWSGITVASGNTGGLPAAGPTASNSGGSPFGVGGGLRASGSPPAGVARNAQPAGGPGGSVSDGLIAYLTANQWSATYLVAVSSANEAAPIILKTNKAVMAMGGFSGSDPILTVASFKQLVASGEVRFVLIGGGGGGFAPPTNADGQSGTATDSGTAPTLGNAPTGRGSTSSVDQWITETCKVVSTSAYQTGTSSSGTSGFGGGQGQTLYDCQGAAS